MLWADARYLRSSFHERIIALVHRNCGAVSVFLLYCKLIRISA